MRKVLFFLFCSILTTTLHAQDFPNIDPKWDKYYNQYPTGIEKKYSASDFIYVMDYVGFQPSDSRYKKYPSVFRKALLGLGPEALRQMMIEGNYYSRTIKHDDFFQLYNLTYKPVSRELWNSLCPYLIPIMKLDGIVSLR